MRVANIIKEKLTEALSPTNLEILDESHKHAGHAGARPEGESHFSVKIVSNAFEGKSRVERQRLVYQALSEELKQDIHALALHTMAPNESEKL
ncbi:MAG: BolA family transcriptional regulator [Rhodospirillaceae bacterium]|jgi:BolA family transcriptional regulator, general stress-responsive regulator|nr:BolA family transcriptional regulator [Rhodospirillaceae bacterium]MBT5244596.1 BolA family transcriptional regulator [Rhodospirillaceae bacterium]MBT5563506.1 BolA family transcriptional regulator [Rhodospirillaceae bacterium]MBT6240763.1 BolA family transcriptional regulator [Rhodospirillaceae bacterium]MBT7137769.1 BolA family transcriptional regulator [Rhodospirillaceae bacterium]